MFFTDKKTNKKGAVIAGSKYISDYDFLFPINDYGKINFSDPVWDSPEDFISGRKKLMLEFLNTKYGISANTSGYRDRNAPHRASLPHHRTYGSVYGDSADQSKVGCE